MRCDVGLSGRAAVRVGGRRVAGSILAITPHLLFAHQSYAVRTPIETCTEAATGRSAEGDCPLWR